MRKIKVIGLIYIALAYSSCMESGDGSTTGVSNSKEAETEGGKIGAGAGKVENELTINVMRYTMASSDLATWGTLLNKSKWSREIQSSQVTFLCPTEDIFDPAKGGRVLISELKRPENQNLLDQVMAKHLLKIQYSIDKLAVMSEVETIDGQMLTVDAVNATIGGIHYTNREILTLNGTVLVIDDVIDYPEKALKASAGKAMKKGI